MFVCIYGVNMESLKFLFRLCPLVSLLPVISGRFPVSFTVSTVLRCSLSCKRLSVDPRFTI